MSKGTRRKRQILVAATETLKTVGLSNWSIDLVAEKANCSKGLVLYHFTTRERLLVEVGTNLRQHHQGTLLNALAKGGTEGLDALWEAIERGVQTGATAARTALLVAPSRPIQRAVTRSDADRFDVSHAMHRVLSLPRNTISPLLLDSMIAGLALLLGMGQPSRVVRDAYDDFFLLLLKRS